MTDPLTVGGLFSGIGGWELGLERAGMKVAWHCESDPFCRRVLAKRWPDVPCFDDVTTLRYPPYVEVLCGGFPCQDISNAGARAGIEGERSGLWGEFYRLVCEVRPRYVLVENVSALVIRGLSVVLADLAALGMDAEWTTLRASDVGAPHSRDRLWIVAYTPSGSGQARDILETGEEWRAPLEPAGVSSLPMAPGWQPRGFWRETKSPSPLLVDGVSAQLDDIRAAGNALVPQIAEWIGQRVIEYEERAAHGSD